MNNLQQMYKIEQELCQQSVFSFKQTFQMSLPSSKCSITSRNDWDMSSDDAQSRDSCRPDDSRTDGWPQRPQCGVSCRNRPTSLNAAHLFEGRLILWAAAMGDEALMAFLLTTHESNLSFVNYCGQTPFCLAAEHGREGVIRLLLSRANTEINLADRDGQSPLAWAAFAGHSRIVHALLERDDLVASSHDTDGNTPLAWAAANGHYAVVVLLLERFDVAVNPVNHQGHTPLQLAAMHDHVEIVRLLQSWTNECPASAGDYGVLQRDARW